MIRHTSAEWLRGHAGTGAVWRAEQNGSAKLHIEAYNYESSVLWTCVGVHARATRLYYYYIIVVLMSRRCGGAENAGSENEVPSRNAASFCS